MSEEKPQGTNDNPIEEDDEDPPAVKVGIDKIVTTIAGMTSGIGFLDGGVIGVIGAAIEAARNKSKDSNSESSDEDE